MKNSLSKKTLKKIIELWGRSAQFNMLMEECAELIMTTNQYLRSRKTKDDIAEEVADVEMVIEQIKFLFDDVDFKKIKKDKKDRLMERIKNE